MIEEISEKQWAKFVVWCKKRYSMWTPNKASVELWLEYKKEKKC